MRDCNQWVSDAHLLSPAQWQIDVPVWSSATDAATSKRLLATDHHQLGGNQEIYGAMSEQAGEGVHANWSAASSQQWGPVDRAGAVNVPHQRTDDWRRLLR